MLTWDEEGGGEYRHWGLLDDGRSVVFHYLSWWLKPIIVSTRPRKHKIMAYTKERFQPFAAPRLECPLHNRDR